MPKRSNISTTLAIGAMLAFATSACVGGSGGGDVTQAQLDAISDECGAPREFLSVVDGEILAQTDENVQYTPADYEASICALSKVKEAGWMTKTAFVGNEIYSETESN